MKPSPPAPTPAQTLATTERPPSSTDGLLLCMALLTTLLGNPLSLLVLRSGMALDDHGHVPHASYPGMAQEHGLLAAWSRTPIRQIPSHVMPVLVPLLDGRACVLLQVQRDEATVLWPETGMAPQLLPLQELERLAQKQVLLVKAPRLRSDQTLAPLHGAAFAWFWGTLWRFRHDYVASMVATVVANVLTLAGVFFTMNVYDRVVPTQAYASLWTLAIGTALAALLEFTMRWLKARLVDLGGKKADLAINATLLREIMAIRLEHRPQSAGIFASAMRDFEALRDFFSSSSLVLLADMPFMLMFLAMIAVVGGPLVWIPALALPFLLLIGLLAQRPLMKAMRENMKESGDKQSVLVEAVLNLEQLKAHNAEGYLQRRWELSNAAGAEAHKKIRSLTHLVMGLSGTVQQLVTVAMVVAGVYLIHAHQLTQGALIASVILAGRALAPLAGVMSLAARFQQAVSSLETLDGLIKRPRDRVHGRTRVVPESVQGSLQAQALEFAYPGEHRIPVIKKLSIQIPAGHRVAMLGRVGSGKSTLLRLMAGLYAPLGGSVRLDGVDLQQLEPSAVRARIGYVGQDPQLFMGTLRENVVLSDHWISDARVLEVLRTLGLYEMVATHPRGLDMPITEAGGGLSGGQRQLLAIARMVVREPQLVFLDEPTAHMDQNTEAHIIAALKPWLQGRTLLMSTHRPQLLEWVDAIAVIEGGQCLACGPRQHMIEQLSRGIDLSMPRAN